MPAPPPPATLFDKLWRSHVIRDFGDGRALIHIDRHVLFEGTSGAAFQGLRDLGLDVADPAATLGVIDHAVSSAPGRSAESFPPSRARILAMRENCRRHGIALLDIDDPHQGITHVVAPELGFALPGCTLVCADSHTATNGGLGCWAWGIGTTEMRHVLANQALILRRPPTMRVSFTGRPGPGVFAKDLILRLIGVHGVAAGTGHAVEYAGEAISALPIEARMTICNMSIEFGARTGFIAVDEATLAYVAARPWAPRGTALQQAMAAWRDLHSDAGAVFDAEIAIDCTGLAPQVTWGTTPEEVIGIDEAIPDPAGLADAARRAAAQRALDYIGLQPGQSLQGVKIDVAFIGSCTNARLSDLEAAARVLRGRKVAPCLRALVVPGSAQVRRAAEALGLDRIFRDAGCEWRAPGCSMCVGTNGDVLQPGQRCITSTNRNFPNRQGPGARTHLASPAMVAAAAVQGCITDLRRLEGAC